MQTPRDIIRVAQSLYEEVKQNGPFRERLDRVFRGVLLIMSGPRLSGKTCYAN